MTTILFRQPANLRLTAPRGAIWAADYGTAAYRFFERIGATRGEQKLLAMADRNEAIDPLLAADLRAAATHLQRASTT